MKLNIKKFMMTEMGGELEETIKAWDQALKERRKATPGIGDPDQGLGFGYWDRTCKSCQDRWEVFKLAIRQFYPMRRKTLCFSYGDIRRVHRIYASN